MHRVELKVAVCVRACVRFVCVPNVPCGVESCPATTNREGTHPAVPNVPCGVEREEPEDHHLVVCPVPNVPCGVESKPSLFNFLV